MMSNENIFYTKVITLREVYKFIVFSFDILTTYAAEILDYFFRILCC
jgi:hypothetical protein